MERRNVLKAMFALLGLGAMPARAVPIETNEDKYWQAQRLIDELHEELDREQTKG